MTDRIHELEYFYEENIHDLRITNFEKARLRLKKLLMYDLETLNKIENTNESRGLTFAHNKYINCVNIVLIIEIKRIYKKMHRKVIKRAIKLRQNQLINPQLRKKTLKTIQILS